MSRSARLLAILFVLFHFLLPLRQFVAVGDVNWSKQSADFSWRMMSSVHLPFKLVFFNGRKEPIWHLKKLTPRAIRQINCDPYLIHRVANKLCQKESVITAYASCLHGVSGRAGLLVRPDVNLCQVKYSSITENSWIYKDFGSARAAQNSFAGPEDKLVKKYLNDILIKWQ